MLPLIPCEELTHRITVIRKRRDQAKLPMLDLQKIECLKLTNLGAEFLQTFCWVRQEHLSCSGLL